MNPDPDGVGLKLNISESDNVQDLELLFEVASFFRVAPTRGMQILDELVSAVRPWRDLASAHGLALAAQDRMKRDFRVVEGWCPAR